MTYSHDTQEIVITRVVFNHGRMSIAVDGMNKTVTFIIQLLISMYDCL